MKRHLILTLIGAVYLASLVIIGTMTGWFFRNYAHVLVPMALVAAGAGVCWFMGWLVFGNDVE